MIRLFWLEKGHSWLKGGAIFFGFVAAVSGGALKASPEDYRQIKLLADALSYNMTVAWWLIPLSTLCAGFLTFLKTHFGNKQIWRVVTFLLEEYRKSVFNGHIDLEGEPDHHFRVTLFKYTGWRWAFCKWPWSGWLVPVARTGHTTVSRRIPRFRASSTNPDSAEGVAGVTFAQKAEIHVNDMPRISSKSAIKARAKYAKKGFVSIRWVDRHLNCNVRCLHGIPIEVKGTIWGSIVVDSRQPNAIPDNRLINEQEFKKLHQILSKVLEN